MGACGRNFRRCDRAAIGHAYNGVVATLFVRCDLSFQAAIAALSIFVLVLVKAPPPLAADALETRPLGEIARQPKFIAAVICGIVSYGLMNFIMTSAPLAMKLCGHAVTDSNLAVEFHVIAMYAPSFFTGALIARFGAVKIILAGMALIVAAAIAGHLGTTVPHFGQA